MFSAILLVVAAIVFAALAYDARRLSTSSREVPYAVTARPLGIRVDGVPAVELERQKQEDLRRGIGELQGVFWLWIIASVGCSAAAAWIVF